MRVYHRTSHDLAARILAEGFRDGHGTYMIDEMFRGVWVSDQPLHEHDGVFGDALLFLDVPEELFVEFEWIESGAALRRSLIPAAFLNLHGPVTLQEDD
jgi:hypothetical protein